MLGKKWRGGVDDMLDAIASAGYDGVEITNTMIGDYFDRPADFAQALVSRRLKFASFGFVPLYRFTDPERVDEEIAHAQRGIEFVAHFPGVRLDLAGGSADDRDDLDAKFETMCTIYNRVARKADAKGVPVDIHPHSHAGSIIETADEYTKLMSMTDADLVGWCPDTGHIVRGGLDLMDTLIRYKDRIGNIHFKDVDERGSWQLMGEGVCDYPEIMSLLEKMDYEGWIIGEEESEAAWKDQKAAITANREYLNNLGY
jgi:sugar phosphate isomerase/epimerase